MPFGIASSCIDAEGLPAQRVELIRENELITFAARQRYADYLENPPTGAFGNIELPPGKILASILLVEPYVEIIQFSWFNPDTITGDFASEISFGYLVENGIRKLFKGGGWWAITWTLCQICIEPAIAQKYANLASLYTSMRDFTETFYAMTVLCSITNGSATQAAWQKSISI